MTGARIEPVISSTVLPRKRKEKKKLNFLSNYPEVRVPFELLDDVDEAADCPVIELVSEKRSF